MRDEKSLAHTRWNCKYHIFFSLKYRGKALYDEKRKEKGRILRYLYEWKEEKILEAECRFDRIYILLEIPPNMNVSSFIRYRRVKAV